MIEAGGPEPVIELADGAAHRGIVEVAGKFGASLVVVGSRGLTGLKALGSVSERASHRASCSVLIVRHPAPPSEEQIDGQWAPASRPCAWTLESAGRRRRLRAVDAQW